jgi:hypothetical protein
MTFIHCSVLGLLVITLAVGASACASVGHIEADGSAAVFRHQDDMLGCEEIGLAAKSDGCFREVPACCASQRHTPPSEAGAIARLAHAAAKMHGNAVMVLRVSEKQRLYLHCESCCGPKSFRAYGVVYHCDESHLRWHEKHEAIRSQ